MDHQKQDQTDNSQALGQQYWDAQWTAGKTGWDIGYASPAITTYMAQYPDKNAAILIPGCGNAYEAAYLAANGFTDITLIDIAPAAAGRLKEKFAGMEQIQVICGDFFAHEGRYDLIIEQTFFCALPPAMRGNYAAKTASLLKENGRITGLLFNRRFEQAGPPFGGDTEEYRQLFMPYYRIKEMSTCYNSIPPRADTEVFIQFVKK